MPSLGNYRKDCRDYTAEALGKIVIFLPDYFSNYYGKFHDLTSILNEESNYECEKIITTVPIPKKKG